VPKNLSVYPNLNQSAKIVSHNHQEIRAWIKPSFREIELKITAGGTGTTIDGDKFS
jgi:molybdopterin biosynthesis enzyme MoaB